MFIMHSGVVSRYLEIVHSALRTTCSQHSCMHLSSVSKLWMCIRQEQTKCDSEDRVKLCLPRFSDVSCKALDSIEVWVKEGGKALRSGMGHPSRSVVRDLRSAFEGAG